MYKSVEGGVYKSMIVYSITDVGKKVFSSPAGKIYRVVYDWFCVSKTYLQLIVQQFEHLQSCK